MRKLSLWTSGATCGLLSLVLGLVGCFGGCADPGTKSVSPAPNLSSGGQQGSGTGGGTEVPMPAATEGTPEPTPAAIEPTPATEPVPATGEATPAEAAPKTE